MKKLINLLLLFALLGLSPPGVAQAQPTEYQLKAVFLLNFARYLDWPEGRLSAGAPLTICVLGRDPFGQALALIDGKQAQGREVRAKLVGDIEETGSCHVLYISDSESRRVGSQLAQLAGRAILTVSDMEGFTDLGGAIGLVNLDDRIGFDINQATLQRDRLKARSQLLKLARRLIKG